MEFALEIKVEKKGNFGQSDDCFSIMSWRSVNFLGYLGYFESPRGTLFYWKDFIIP